MDDDVTDMIVVLVIALFGALAAFYLVIQNYGDELKAAILSRFRRKSKTVKNSVPHGLKSKKIVPLKTKLVVDGFGPQLSEREKEAKNGDIEMNGKTKRVRIVHPCPTAEERNEASQIPESSVVSSLKQDSSPVERRFTL